MVRSVAASTKYSQIALIGRKIGAIKVAGGEQLLKIACWQIIINYK